MARAAASASAPVGAVAERARADAGRGYVATTWRRLRRDQLSMAALVLLVAGGMAWPVWHEHKFTLCGFESSKPAAARAAASGYHLRWDYTPPGWVCVYTDRSGRVVAERRP